MRTLTLSLIAVLALGASFATPAIAAPNVGDDAPSLGSLSWAMNEPETYDLRQLRGQVVLVEKWGITCPPCVAAIPGLQEIYERWTGQGFHLITIETWNANADRIRQQLADNGGDFQVAMGGAPAYQTRGVPHAWLIGVDGKVVWRGNPYNKTVLEAQIESAMESVTHVAIDPADFHEDVQDAAEDAANQEFEDARRSLERLQRRDLDEAVAADVERLSTMINEIGQQWLARAEGMVDERDYLAALEMFEKIEEAFGRGDEGETARDRRRELERDDDVERELDALEEWERLEARLRRVDDAEARAAVVGRFLEEHEGTRAAELAQQFLRSGGR